MIGYIGRRLGYMAVLLVAISMVAFFVIQLPPGDYLTVVMASMAGQGMHFTEEQVLLLKERFGLDLPMHLQYLRWAWNLLQGDLGLSFSYGRPVMGLVLDRLPLTMLISLLTILFAYAVAIPIGIYSATHQYSLGDYGFTVLGFVGLATPNFLLALLLMYVLLKLFGISAGGLFSPEYEFEPWSVARVVDALLHLPLPVLVAGTAGTAAVVRVMRSTLLDELKKQYVITARAKGVAEQRLVMKYPVRVALNPIIATAGWLLPEIVSGSTIVAIVLSLPTVAPLLLRALTSQDSYLAGSIIMVLAALTVIGTLASDLLLAAHRPAHPLRAQMRAFAGLRAPAARRNRTARHDPTALEEGYYLATQWQLMRRRFRAHKLALIGATVLIVLYLTTLLGEFFAPYDSFRRFADYPFAPPQRLRFIDQGRVSPRPFVYGYERFRDPESLRWRFNVDRSLRYPLSFFVRGDEYYVLGLFETDLHLFGVAGEEAHLFLFGTDKLGRDLFSRNIRAARISLTIGLVGVTISFILGCILGGISGYYGGAVDTLIQRDDRVPDIDPVDSAVDGAGRLAAQRLAADPGLLRHHHHPLGDQLDQPGAGGAQQAAGAARGGLRDGRQDRRRARGGDRAPPPAAVVSQLSDREPHLEHPRHDPRRDRPQLPRHRHPAARPELGRAAAERAERAQRGAGTVAVHPGPVHRGHGAGLQLRRRRPARRRRPLHLSHGERSGWRSWRGAILLCCRQATGYDMTKSKLTLSLDPAVVRAAKRLAAARNTSVSALFSCLIQSLQTV